MNIDLIQRPILLITLSMFLLISCESEMGSDLVTTSDLMTPTMSAPAPLEATPPEENLESGTVLETIPETVLETVPETVPETVTAPIEGTTITQIDPVEIEETGCEIETSIDLAGYANLENAMGCPIGPANIEPIAVNEFGPGPDFDRFMLWFSTDQLIYVLSPEGQWQTYPDTWTEEMPIFACNPMQDEPSSPPLPRRGFGKVWCDHEEIRQQLGLIIREERLCQHAALQPFERGRMLACYEDATVRYFILLNDQTWRVDFVQY